MITKERLENIKENVYMRSEIAKFSGLGIDSSLKEELELIEEIDRLNKEVERLNNIINELEKYIKTEAKIELYKDKTGFRTFADSDDILNKIKELKEGKYECKRKF